MLFLNQRPTGMLRQVGVTRHYCEIHTLVWATTIRQNGSYRVRTGNRPDPGSKTVAARRVERFNRPLNVSGEDRTMGQNLLPVTTPRSSRIPNEPHRQRPGLDVARSGRRPMATGRVAGGNVATLDKAGSRCWNRTPPRGAERLRADNAMSVQSEQPQGCGTEMVLPAIAVGVAEPKLLRIPDQNRVMQQSA